MSGYHELPDPPEGWSVSTNVENTINYYGGSSSSPLVVITPDQNPLASGWTVGVIGSDRWDQSPHFATDAELEEAVDTAHSVIEALATDTEIEPVGYIRDSDTSATGTDSDSPAAPDEESNSDSESGGQVDLSAFAE